MATTEPITMGKYRLPVDRHYDPATHLWVTRPAPHRLRCGFDPLSAETSGDLVALAFEPVGTELERGKAFGSLEAAKFVGPLLAPVSGRLAAHNTAVLARPGLINREPFDSWLVEWEVADPDAELGALLRDPDAIAAWLQREIRRFEDDGMLAR